ncbi:hypothetical protein [Pontiella desulfatans]|nr:hypothetical protein [Pontiella desulfatans]
MMLSVVLLGLSGCKSVEERIEIQREEVEAHYPQIFTDPSRLPEKVLDWETALSMIDGNLALRTANNEIINAEVAIDRVFWDLVPQLTMQGIYNTAISEFTELSSDNFNGNVNALFSIPGFVRLRMDYYAAVLSHYAATQQYELTYREEVLNLYSLFRKSHWNRQESLIEDLESSHPTFTESDRRELAFARKQRENELWLAVSGALGCHSNRWVLVGDQLPEIDYMQSDPAILDTDTFGGLYTTIQALELEGARLREFGVKFQYWPQLDTRVYSPSVYLFSAGDRGGFNFDAEDIRFEASVSMKLDTNLSITHQLRETRRSTDLLKQKLYEEAEERVKALVETRDALHLLEDRMTRLAAKESLFARLGKPSTYAGFEMLNAERLELKKERLALEREADALVPVLWIADDSRWQVPAEWELAD